MTYQVLIAHAKGEEEFAEQLAGPIREAGYKVAHQGTVMVGESVVEEASKILSAGNPVVLCGTVKTVGTKWGRQVINAAHGHSGVRVFAVQMEEEADVESLTFDARIARYWQDSAKAKKELIDALRKYYPLGVTALQTLLSSDAERRYRDLAEKSCDIIDLTNLPESDRHIVTRKLELRRLYVALRVRVEALKGTDADEPILEALEKRRDVLQKQPWGRMSSGERENKSDERVSVGERLAKARRLVVLGDPGAGKTTLIRWIATAYLLRFKQDLE